ncbi:MAG: translation initiation factor IF-2 [Gemmatimonadetes bacterium]|nr:translation initiation factor IF-2 [Gemmatimonadota bacterium]MCY3944268.1 translation initiation factor IF-2 [Gemmatimonadota bacterium]
MLVKELAVDLRVNVDVLLGFLRESGVRVGHADARIDDMDVARIRTRLERERRAGRGEAADVMAEAAKGRKPASRRRRRRRGVAPPPPAPESESAEEVRATEEPEVAEAAPEAADAALAPPQAAEVEEASTTSPPVEAETTVPTVEEAEAATSEGAELHPDEESQAAAEQSAAIPAPDAKPDAELPPAEPIPPPPQPDPATRPRSVRDGAPSGLVPGIGPVIPPLEPAASAGPGGRVRVQAQGYTSDGRRKSDRRRGRRRRSTDRSKAKENIQRVMAELKGGRKRRRKGKATVAAAKEERAAAEERAAEMVAAEARTVRVNEFLTVSELAELIDTAPADIIGSAFRNIGLPVTINQRLDFDQIELLLEEFGFKAVRETDYLPAEEETVEDDPADLRPRPPVVTVMGHVDHGKTRLLDWVRDTNVVAGEAGGITQHIGAYHVVLEDGRSISFLDTPGHAAFTAMRARGAEVTDIVVLVVAADDSVMPQTIEAISHARNAGAPMVVAVNKIDLATADPERVKRELLQHGVTVEDFGGDTLVAEVSAATGQGMGDLLDKILLQAEILELQANPGRTAKGAVVEAELDVGKGPVTTILVQNGTLRVGDSFVVGLFDGRARALLDERGRNVDEAGPGVPVQILGTAGVPQAGDIFQVVDAVTAASISTSRQRLDREKQLRIRERGVKLGDFQELLAAGDVGTLRLVVKGDVDGSVQALCDSLGQLSGEEVQVEIIHRGVGAVNESDVTLALTADAVIVGFRVRPDAGARQTAARTGVDIQTYDVIYEAVDDVRAALEGLLAPERRESVLGSAEARVIFRIRGVGTIAGSYVVEGAIQRGAAAHVVRDGVVIYDGEVGSLRRFKEDVREVKEGFECGIGIADFNDLKVGDIIEAYQVQEFARTLDTA